MRSAAIVPAAVIIALSSPRLSATVMPVGCVGSTRHQARSTPRTRSSSSTKRPAASSPTTPDVSDTEAEPCCPARDDPARPAERERAGIGEPLGLAEGGLDRLARDDRVRVQLPDHEQVQAFGAHRRATSSAATGVRLTSASSRSTPARSTRPECRRPSLSAAAATPRAAASASSSPRASPAARPPTSASPQPTAFTTRAAGSAEMQRLLAAHQHRAALPEAQPHGARPAPAQEPLREGRQRVRVGASGARPTLSPSRADSSARFGLTRSGAAPRAS